MSAPSSLSTADRQLIVDFALDQFEEADLDRLRNLLHSSRAARRLYRDYMTLVAGLTWECQPVSIPESVPASQADAAAAPQPGADSESPRRIRYVTGVQLAGAAAVCAAFFAGYVVFITWGILDGKEAGGWKVEAGRERVAEEAGGWRLEAGGEQVATITGSEDARWVAGRTAAANQQSEITNQKSEVHSAEPLSLASGIVELQLKQGVTLVVEGPANWTIDGDNAATLRRGKLVAVVPPRATGFTVTTPTARIVDLGTEFGVEVDSSGTCEVHVIRGAVESRSLDAGASASTTSKLLRLEAGMAARIAPGQALQECFPADLQRFTTITQQVARRDTSDPPVFAGPIPLGNLFDNDANVTLPEALQSDVYQAPARRESLGVEYVAIGGPARIPFAFRLLFDATNFGWTGVCSNEPANDAFAPHERRPAEVRPIRTRGNAEDLKPGKAEDGIGMHADSLLTFNVDILREAGQLGTAPLRFVCDRAGLNDPTFGNNISRVNMLVLLASAKEVQLALVDGEPAEVVERDGLWQLARPPAGCMKSDGRFFSVNLPLRPDTRYLTLAVAGAGNDITSDHAVWSGARLEVVRQGAAEQKPVEQEAPMQAAESE